MGKEQFSGSWKLVSSEFRTSSGKVSYPLGKEPTGLIIYDPAGYVSAQLMGKRRPTFVSGDHLKGTPEEIKGAFESYITYYGTFEIDEKEHAVNHHVEGCSFPNWQGQVLRRYYEFIEDRLILSTPEMKMGGERVKAVITWKRAGPVAPKLPSGCPC